MNTNDLKISCTIPLMKKKTRFNALSEVEPSFCIYSNKQSYGDLIRFIVSPKYLNYITSNT